MLFSLFRFLRQSLIVDQASLKFDMAKDNLKLLILLPPSLRAGITVCTTISG